MMNGFAHHAPRLSSARTSASMPRPVSMGAVGQLTVSKLRGIAVLHLHAMPMSARKASLLWKFQLTCNHRRRILAVTHGMAGSLNDKVRTVHPLHPCRPPLNVSTNHTLFCISLSYRPSHGLIRSSWRCTMVRSWPLSLSSCFAQMDRPSCSSAHSVSPTMGFIDGDA